jgi:antitoxin ParD1/3/4
LSALFLWSALESAPVVATSWQRLIANLCYSLLFLLPWSSRKAEVTMNVSLTPELEKFVDRKVESGLYNNASEVVREGLRLLKEHDEIRLKWRDQIERGWHQAQRGELVDGNEVFDRLDKRLTARRTRSK